MMSGIQRIVLLSTVATLLLGATATQASPKAGAKEEFPKFEIVSKDYVEVISTADGAKPFYRVWKRDKDAQLLAELPGDYQSKKFFVVPTVAGGDSQLGVYSIWHYLVGKGARYLHWKRYDKKLALLEPNLAVRTLGDAESKLATQRIYTDTVVLTAPIVCMGPGGGPVIDLDQVLLQNSGKFFGRFTAKADFGLTKIESAKAFPYNLELTLSFPRVGGQLARIHYSIGTPPPSPGYKPREADRRVGIYYVDFIDRAKYDTASPKRRYVERWHLEKADPSLKLSPPKQPIIYYIEHTTPIRYRRWVRDGILAWNRAFEQVGLLNAIEVYQQDATTGAHMDKDPEDLRYSFVRWTNAGMGFAIGPSHVDPETGRIYEADIVMDENFLRSWRFDKLDTELASAAMSTMDADLADWLAANPSWDPRYRLARPAHRAAVLRYQRALAEGTAGGMEPPPTMEPEVWDVHREALGLPSTTCLYQRSTMFGATMLRTAMALGLDAPLAADGAADDEMLLDGLPEEFVGPLLKDVIMHEVGHTMGLMHNWKGSAAYEFSDINSDAHKGTLPITGSIMDYAPTNIVVEGDGLVQGDHANIDIGPYDMWAIEWSYTFEDPEPIARRAAEPGLAFSAEEGQTGPDPQAKVWDLGRNSVDMAEARMHFVEVARDRIIEQGVGDNESWQKARQLYSHLLGAQFYSVAAASNWIGGAYVNKYRKGDPGATDPITPVEVEHQRRALQFVIDTTLNDEAYGLDPDLLRKLAVDQWYDEGFESAQDFPIHDQVLALQSVTLTMLMNPTRLRRIQDNELRTDAGEDTLTMPEVLNALRDTIWIEPGALEGNARYTNRDPMFSTLTRNLQREHLNRLIDLARGMRWPNASGATIATLARQQLRDLRERITAYSELELDDYTRAHLADAGERIDRALEAAYIRVD
jgi:hypothetical protein